MILSRTLARSRIAAGTRPGWWAAWGPVMIDALSLAAVLGVAFTVLIGPLSALNLPLPVTIIVFFLIFFIPIQIVLVVSSLWATRSRWVESDAPPSQSDHDGGNIPRT